MLPDTSNTILLYITIILSGASFIIFMYLFVSAFKIQGDENTLKDMQSKTMNIWIIVAVASFCLLLSCLIFFYTNPDKAVYFTLVVACLALGISYASFALAAVAKKNYIAS